MITRRFLPEVGTRYQSRVPEYEWWQIYHAGRGRYSLRGLQHKGNLRRLMTSDEVYCLSAARVILMEDFAKVEGGKAIYVSEGEKYGE
jgi:hypothetical protein